MLHHIGIVQLSEYRNTVVYDMVVTAPKDLSVEAIKPSQVYPFSTDIDLILIPHRLRSELLGSGRPPRGYVDLFDCGRSTFLHEYHPDQYPPPDVGLAILSRFSIMLIPVRATIEDFQSAQRISSYAWFSSKICIFMALRTDNSDDQFAEKLAALGPVAPVKFSFRGDGASLSNEAITEGRALWVWLRAALDARG